MLEMMMMGSKPIPVSSDYYFDINFEKSVIGNREIKDVGVLGVQFQRMVYGGVDGEGVVDDPTHGKCYRFNGNSLFNGDRLLNLWDKKFRLVIKFVNGSNVEQRLLTTGDWNSYNPAQQGWTLLRTSGDRGTWQVFCFNGGALLINPNVLDAANTMEEYVMEGDGAGVFTLTNMRTGAKATQATGLEKESVLVVGGTFSNGVGSFVGLLKSITVELL